MSSSVKTSSSQLDTLAPMPEEEPQAVAQQAVAEQATSPEWKPSRHELLIMIAFSVVSFIVALDACIIVTSLSALITDLRGTSTEAFWVGTSYMLACAVCMPWLAAVSDIFGRPLLVMASMIAFTAGTIICAVAQTPAVLLVGRVIQGTGGGGIIILSLVVFTDIVPLRYRPKWYGIVQGAWALGSCVGPVIGGGIAQNISWRWIFYIDLPVLGVGLVVMPLLLTLRPTRVSTFAERLARVDWLGGALFVGGATTFLVAVSWGGVQYPWDSAGTIAPLVVGLAGVVASLAWEAYGAREPFLRHSLFATASQTATYLCGAVQGLVIYGQLFYVPFFFLSIKGYSPVLTGVALLPAMATLVPGSIAAGVLVSRFGRYRWLIWVGWVLIATGSALTVLWDADTSVAVWVVTELVLGFGHGAVMTSQNFAAQAMCRPREEGHAAAMYAFVRQLGTAVGVAAGGNAFQNVQRLKLSWEGLPLGIADASEAFLPQLLALPEGDFKTKVMSSYLFGFKGVFQVYLGISGVAFFVSLLIRHRDLDKSLDSCHALHESRVSRMLVGTGGNRPGTGEMRSPPPSPTVKDLEGGLEAGARKPAAAEEIRPVETVKAG